MGKLANEATGDGMRSPALGCALNYFAVFLMLGIQLPYLPVWLDGRGFSSVEIGLICGAPLWVRIVAGPIVGMFADRHQAHRGIVVALMALAAASAALLIGASGFWWVMALVTLLLVASQAGLPLVDVLAMDTARSHQRDYGRMRLWGSLAFVAANLIGGALLASAGSEAVILLLLSAAVLTTIAATRLPSRVSPQNQTGEPTATSAIQIHSSLFSRDIRAMLVGRQFLLLIVAAGTVQASHAVYYAFSVLHWQALGWSSGWIGVLWALGVIAEIALFAVSRQVMAWAGAGLLLAIGAVAAIVRWTTMALEPGVALTVALQVMHALSFGATHLATMHLIQRIAPAGRAATAQALNAALGGGLAMALALLLAGVAYKAAGAQAYLVMAALAAVGLTAALRLSRDIAIQQP